MVHTIIFGHLNTKDIVKTSIYLLETTPYANLRRWTLSSRVLPASSVINLPTLARQLSAVNLALPQPLFRAVDHTFQYVHTPSRWPSWVTLAAPLDCGSTLLR